MMKKNKWKILITSMITLSPMLAGCILWSKLPDTIATHFGTDNTANGWSSKGFAVFGIPLLIAALHLFCLMVTSADPKIKNISGRPLGIVFWICPSISILTGTVIYTAAFEIPINIGFICCFFLGILFIVIGNYLPKCRQNYSFGIKIPWTLNDAENWNRTHRVAGWCMSIAGVMIAATSFLQNSWIFGTLLAISLLIPIAYSYIYYRRHKEK